MPELKIVNEPIDKLIHAEYNPRKIDPLDFDHLKKSLNKFAAVEPAVINTHPKRKNIIVGGNQRIDAAKSLGWETFPCVHVKLSLKDERELNVRLNKNQGKWDYSLLKEFFSDRDELLSFGFQNEELAFFDSIDKDFQEEKSFMYDDSGIVKFIVQCDKDDEEKLRCALDDLLSNISSFKYEDNIQ